MSKYQQNSINIEITPEIGQGEYVNFQTVTFSPMEFILDFARLSPGMPRGKVLSRIIMHPATAKGFADHLGKAVKSFEEKHGTINIENSQQNSDSIGFKFSENSEKENNK